MPPATIRGGRLSREIQDPGESGGELRAERTEEITRPGLCGGAGGGPSRDAMAVLVVVLMRGAENATRDDWI